MNDVFEMVETDDLTADLQIITEICGIETVRKLLKHFAGLNFYIPKLSRLETFVLRYIKLNKSIGFKRMAKDLGVSEYFLRCLEKKYK